MEQELDCGLLAWTSFEPRGEVVSVQVSQRPLQESHMHLWYVGTLVVFSVPCVVNDVSMMWVSRTV